MIHQGSRWNFYTHLTNPVRKSRSGLVLLPSQSLTGLLAYDRAALEQPHHAAGGLLI